SSQAELQHLYKVPILTIDDSEIGERALRELSQTWPAKRRNLAGSLPSLRARPAQRPFIWLAKQNHLRGSPLLGCRRLKRLALNAMRHPLDDHKERRNEEDCEGGGEEHAGYGHRPDQTAGLAAGTQCVPQRIQADDEREGGHENGPQTQSRVHAGAPIAATNRSHWLWERTATASQRSLSLSRGRQRY